jgi:hypothetical protein
MKKRIRWQSLNGEWSVWYDLSKGIPENLKSNIEIKALYVEEEMTIEEAEKLLE